MGTLRYGAADLTVEDRLLAHVCIVIAQKLRRNESFLLTLPDQRGKSASESIWLGPQSDISFVFSGNRAPSLNHEWLEQMMTESYSSRGLDVNLHSEPHVVPQRAAAGLRAV
jgi:hypothetical protein